MRIQNCAKVLDYAKFLFDLVNILNPRFGDVQRPSDSLSQSRTMYQITISCV